MAKYQVLMQYSDGTEELDDGIFDTEEDAEEYGCYLVGCCRTGAETLNLSNPGGYPLDEFHRGNISYSRKGQSFPYLPREDSRNAPLQG